MANTKSILGLQATQCLSQLLHSAGESSPGRYLNKRVWLCSNKTGTKESASMTPGLDQESGTNIGVYSPRTLHFTCEHCTLQHSSKKRLGKGENRKL